jgi:hypothetical protein
MQRIRLLMFIALTTAQSHSYFPSPHCPVQLPRDPPWPSPGSTFSVPRVRTSCREFVSVVRAVCLKLMILFSSLFVWCSYCVMLLQSTPFFPHSPSYAARHVSAHSWYSSVGLNVTRSRCSFRHASRHGDAATYTVQQYGVPISLVQNDVDDVSSRMRVMSAFDAGTSLYSAMGTQRMNSIAMTMR